MKNSPLADRHVSLSAKMADFGGWLMPIEYPGAGVLAEHAAVRERVGIFDVSHLGKVSVKGSGALQFLNTVFTNDLERITDGQAQYTLHCNSEGGVIDDLIVYRNSPTDLFLIPNASNTTSVVADLMSRVPAGIEIVNLHESFGVIAVQGPKSREVIESFGVNPEMDYMAFAHVSIANCDVILCRTGYTGEDGFEIMVPEDRAIAFWQSLAAAGVRACGLGARDTLRLEAGMALYGQDMDETVSPYEAGLAWTVTLDDGRDFIGRPVLEKQLAEGSARQMIGLVMDEKGVLRHGQAVFSAAGGGEILSGTFSPTLSKGIALARVPAGEVGAVEVDIRGRRHPLRVVKYPFVRDGKPQAGV